MSQCADSHLSPAEGRDFDRLMTLPKKVFLDDHYEYYEYYEYDHQNNASKIKKALGCAYRSHLNDAESVSYVCCAAKKKSTRRSDHILGVHHGCQILKMTTFRDNETTLVVTI